MKIICKMKHENGVCSARKQTNNDNSVFLLINIPMCKVLFLVSSQTAVLRYKDVHMYIHIHIRVVVVKYMPVKKHSCPSRCRFKKVCVRYELVSTEQPARGSRQKERRTETETQKNIS